MALTYAESSELMQNADFRSRIMVACLRVADYIAAEANDIPAHNTRASDEWPTLAWAARR